MLAVLLASCSLPIKGYEGTKRSRDQTAHIRAVHSGDGLIEVQLLNAVTSEPLDSGFVKTYDRTPWMSIPAEELCVHVGSRWLDCPGPLEALSPHNPGCRGVSPWVEQEICFAPEGGGTYEIEARTHRSERCWQDPDLTGFWLMNVNSGETVHAYPIEGLCRP